MITPRLRPLGRIALMGLWIALTAPVSHLRAAVVPREAYRAPEGWTLKKVAGPPLIHHPVMAGWDDQGRLYVAETSGENLSRAELEERLPGRITRLEDRDGDGVFDHSVVFADQLTFPQGALWQEGALYVAAPPGIWKLEDLDDDGVADRRTLLAKGFDFTGNAADVHGPFAHPDGRLYWCHGRKGHDVVQNEDPSEQVSRGKGARIWSCLPDGSDIQVHAGGGMDNPTELISLPNGDLLGTVNLFYGRPRGDVLVHWVRGGVYPRRDQQAVLEEFPRTGPLLTEALNFGHVAVSGIAPLEPGTLGVNHPHSAAVALFNTHKVVQVDWQRDGATYVAREKDLIEFLDADTHPTDVLEHPDGSLLIVDTGGWFRIGCPTSQTAKPDIHGAIYRLEAAGTKPRQDPWGLQEDWAHLSAEDCIRRLEDPREPVRNRARIECRKRTECWQTLVNTLESRSDRILIEAAWWATTQPAKSARPMLGSLIRHASEEVRQAAAAALGRLPMKETSPELLASLLDEDPGVRRITATSLGRLGHAGAAPAIANALGTETDRWVEHALLHSWISLREQNSMQQALNAPSEELRRRALIAWSADTKRPPLPPDWILKASRQGNPSLRTEALRHLQSHLDHYLEHLPALIETLLGQDGNLPPVRAVSDLSAALIQSKAGLEWWLKQHPRFPADSWQRQSLEEAVEQAQLQEVPPVWKNYLVGLLEEKAPQTSQGLLSWMRHWKVDPDLNRALEGLRKQVETGGELWFSTLLAGVPTGHPASPALFEALLQSAQSAPGQTRRELACRTLAQARLTREQLHQVVAAFPALGTLEFSALLQPFWNQRDEALGRALVEAFPMSRGAEALPYTEIQRLLSRYPESVRDAARSYLQDRQERQNAAAASITRITEALPSGNARKGKALFESATLLCQSCHRIQGNGGHLGPDLSRIGRIRNRRDLVEAIVLPSASIARDHESWIAETATGDSYTGVLLESTSESVVLGLAGGTETRLGRSSLSRLETVPTSLMPQGYGEALPREQLADLVAYLQSLQ